MLSRLAFASFSHSSSVRSTPFVFSLVMNHFEYSISSTKSALLVGSPPVKVNCGMYASLHLSITCFHSFVVISCFSA